jgi:CheY-like chemotaxis protein
MAKVLLVEDDNNLREIFEMRLQAEGYDTATASDGEEALASAIKEKPDLIIADVMMPKMSGFEMLENLRNSPDMAQTKVIMMTALGQAEDRARGEKLGVIKYLVKSQVTLEDFVRTVREVVGGPAGENDKPAAGQSNTANNNLGGKMDNNSQPTNPAPAGGDMPAGGDAGGANPVSGGADSGQMSSAQAQDSMNNQVAGAMGDGGAAPAGDMGGTPSDVPMSTPPAEPAGGDGGAAPAGGDMPAGGDAPAGDGTGGAPSAPAAPGGM